MKMTTQEGNKLIAEFMGSCGLETEGVPNMGMVRHAKYHTSWDWLMPVVEKIENVLKEGWVKIVGEIGLYECTIDHIDWDGDRTITIQSQTSKIEATWDAVLKFIQWYNKLNK